MRIASIDIGTNSVLLLIADISDDGSIVHIHSDISEPRLGENLTSSDLIMEKPLARTAEAVRNFAKLAIKMGSEKIIPFGTEVFRRAKNGSDSAEFISNSINLPLRILSPEEEARYAFVGALSGLSVSEKNAVIDVGGGSSEIAWGKDLPEGFISLPFGAVIVAEKCPAFPPFNNAVKERVFDWMKNERDNIPLLDSDMRVVAVGGTITTLAGISLSLDKYVPEKIHGHILTKKKIEKIFEEMYLLDADSIALKIPFAPNRADIILAGTAIYLYLMDVLHAESLTVSDRGPRWGIIISELTN